MRVDLRKYCFHPSLLLLPLLLGVSGTALPQILMSSDTESELTQRVRPPKNIIDLIIQDEPESVSQLEECIANGEHDRTTVTDLFSASIIRLNNDSLPDYFVRPAITPYCGAFYGAHLFRYWFVTSYREMGRTRYRIAFKGGGDEVRVLKHFTNGYRDLELVGHNAMKIATSSWRFDGKNYTQTGCILRDVHPEDKRTSPC